VHEHFIPHHESGEDPIARVVAEVRDTDVFIDLGSGAGKVAIAVASKTRARVRGIEIQPDLVERARASAGDLDVEFVCADARDAFLDDGTIFYLYLPFTGPVLDRVMERLRAIPHRIVVCALGVDLSRFTWLRRRELDDFWLEIYDRGDAIGGIT
jgi:hypothetical protein